MPDAPGLELIASELRDAHPDSVLGTYHEHGQACLIVDPEQVLDVLAWLRDTPGQEYRFLSSVHGGRLPARRAAVRRPLRAPQPRPGRADPGPGRARRPRRRTSCPEIDSLRRDVPDRRVPGARGLRLLRHRLPRPPGPAADPAARGLRRLAAAARLPDRRRAGDLHPQRAPGPGVVTSERRRQRHRAPQLGARARRRPARRDRPRRSSATRRSSAPPPASCSSPSTSC